VNVRSISAQTVQNTKEIADAKRAKEDLARQVETDKTELTKHVVDLRITTATLVTVVQQLTGEIQDLRQDIREKK
jgi:predicted  nucleic acid-binding Zn-ribbon protein